MPAVCLDHYFPSSDPLSLETHLEGIGIKALLISGPISILSF
jgi:hypothetical protein